MKPRAIGIIMAGGLGERFWPVTSEANPKYALRFNHSKTLIGDTYERLRLIYPANAIYVITVKEHAALIRKLLPQLPAAQILAEPLRRNTAGAGTYAGFELKRRFGADTVVSFFPADAMIKDRKRFAADIKLAIQTARQTNRLVVLGITPTFPATGYGYVEMGTALSSDLSGVYQVRCFTEKPPLAQAKRFLQSKRFLWNAGIFTWRLADFEAELKKHAPDYWKSFYEVYAGTGSRGSNATAVKKLFERLPVAPIDKLLMEKTKNGAVVRSVFDWDDIGAWDALGRIEPDAKGNTLMAYGVIENVHNSIISVPSHIKVAVAGLKDVVVVHHGDHLLVCHRGHCQEVSRLRRQVLATPPADKKKARR